MKKVLPKFLKIAKFFVLVGGIIFFVSIILSFSSIPFWTRYWLATSLSDTSIKPQYIIMLGGGTMPNEANLIRLYYTSELSKKFPKSSILVAQPNFDSSNMEMRDFLVKMGVANDRIMFETRGLNTRSQAMNIKQMVSGIDTCKCLIVTSPEHMRRSVLTFRKLGFDKVAGYPAFENLKYEQIPLDADTLGGRRFVPDFGFKNTFRYDFWNYLIYQISIARELTAIFYYWLKDWV